MTSLHQLGAENVRATRLLATGFAVFVGLLAPVSGASAEDVGSRATDSASLARSGEEAYAHGEYQRALDDFERAYALTGGSDLLYRVGVTAERLGRDERALAAFREYLRLFPRGAEHDQVGARIAILEVSSEERTSPVSDPAAAATATAHAGTPPAAPIDRSSVPASASRSSVGFFVGAGAAAVTLGVGVAYWLNRDNALEDCTQAIAEGGSCSDEDALRRQRNAGISLAAIGGAALPALIVVGVLRARDREPDDADMVWLPTLDPIARTASLGVAGRF